MASRNRITILNITSTVILQALAFFSGPIFSSMLGPSNYGIAAVYYSWVQIASFVFPLNAAGSIAISRVRYPLKDQNKYQASVLTLAGIFYFVFSALTLIVFFAAKNFLQVKTSMLICGLLHGWGLYCVSFCNNKFTYEFKAGKNFLLSVATSVLTITLSIVFIHFFPESINYWGRILGQALVYTIIGSIIFISVLWEGKVFYNKEYWKFTLPIGIPTVFHLLANVVLNQSDKIMLQSIVSSSAAGIYALACTFSAVLSAIYSALNNSWVPFYYEYTRQNNIEEMKKHAKNYIELFTIISMGFILLSKEVFRLYANRRFWGGTDLIPLFSVGFYFVFLYSFPVNYEFYNTKTKTIAVGTTFAAICNIILNYLLIRILDINGAVIATVISHGLQFLFHFFSAKKINPGEFPFTILDFLPGFIAVCGTCLLYSFTKELWFIRWGAGIALGAYLLMSIIRRKEIF